MDTLYSALRALVCSNFACHWVLSFAGCAVRNAESSPPALAHRQEGAGLTGNELHEEHEATGQPPAQTFRDFYVKTFSSAFATELFDLQQVCITPSCRCIPPA